MQHSSGENQPTSARADTQRGQVEPLAAIAAVLAIAAALTLYSGVLVDLLSGGDSRETPDIVLERSVEATSAVGIVELDRLDTVTAATPTGWQVNATITAGGEEFVTGPDPPENAEERTQRVNVRTEPGTVTPGQFRVVVWR